MNRFPAISALRRVFFTPIDQNRVDQIRQKHEYDIALLNIINIR